MRHNVGNNPKEQMRLEHKRFLARQRPKPVLADRIKRREERAKKKDGSESVNLEEMRE